MENFFNKLIYAILAIVFSYIYIRCLIAFTAVKVISLLIFIAVAMTKTYSLDNSNIVLKIFGQLTISLFVIPLLLTELISKFVVHPFYTIQLLINFAALVILKVAYFAMRILYALIFGCFSIFSYIIFFAILMYKLTNKILFIPVGMLMGFIVCGVLSNLHVVYIDNIKDPKFLSLLKINKIIVKIKNVIRNIIGVKIGGHSDCVKIDPDEYYDELLLKYINRSDDEDAVEEKLYIQYKSSLKILGLDHFPTEEELISKHRELAKKLHPDANGGDAFSFYEMTSAYNNVLKYYR